MNKAALLTGGSGRLGSAILASGCLPGIMAPGQNILDITKPKTIKAFFDRHKIDAVIHAAAMARMSECEADPLSAVSVNIMGTYNLVREVLSRRGRRIRFVYISTDGVYPGTKGRYREDSAVQPYNKYGWTKLGGENAARLVPDHCIIRTSFFDPKDVRFGDAATDMYSSKAPIDYIARAICLMMEDDYVGTINIGAERSSEYERYKKFRPSIKKTTFKVISRRVPFQLAKDASLDIKLWKRIEAR